MTINPKYNVERELAAALDLVYEVFIELWDIRLDLEEGRSIMDILNPPFNPLKTVENTELLTMSFDPQTTSSDNSSPAFLIPSPQELSDIFSNEYTREKIERKFR